MGNRGGRRSVRGEIGRQRPRGTRLRVAVLSDVHGFSLALETVLADLAAGAPVDETIVAGDHCEVGPAPAAVLDRLRSAPFTVLYGNTDRDLVVAANEGGGGAEVRFALDEICAGGIDYLAQLPFSRRVTPPGGTSPDDDLLAVHANPHDVDGRLHPDMSDRELRKVLDGTRAAVVAFGHVHIAYTRQVGATLLADVSAVGNPKDGDLRCKYGLFEWDPEARRWQAEIRRLDYPLEATTAQILASGLPNPDRTLKKLERASY